VSVVAQQGRTHFVHLLAQDKNGATQANLTNNGVYFFKNKHGSNLYLDAANSSSGANVKGAAFNGSAAQQWKALKIAEGVYEFAPMVNQNLRLDVVNADDANGTRVQTFIRNTAYYAQQFLFVKRTDGSYSFIPRCAPESYLDKSTSNNNVQIWARGGGQAQRWLVETDHKLDTPAIGQEKSKWCWVASALMAAKTNGSSSKTQTQIFLKVNPLYVLAMNRGGSLDDNKKAANYASGTTNYYIVERALTENELLADLSAGKPVIIHQTHYTDNVPWGGHVVVVYGYKPFGNSYLFMVRDPWPIDPLIEPWPVVHPGQTYSRTYAGLLQESDSTIWTGSIRR